MIMTTAIVYRFSILFLGLWVFVSCDKEREETVPACIQEMIDENKNGDASTPAEEIHRWSTKTTTYYYVVSECCDQYNYLLDETCQIVCAPDGGINGAGDGNCPYFGESFETDLIWKK